MKLLAFKLTTMPLAAVLIVAAYVAILIAVPVVYVAGWWVGEWERK